MTAVVAIEHASGVLIGSDSFQGGDGWKDRALRPKWFALGPHLVIGYAGLLRPIQVVRAALKRQARAAGETAEAYLRRVVVDPIAVASKPFVGKDAELPSYLVAYDGKAYLLDEDYALLRGGHGVVAIGAGEDIAFGAIIAARKLRPAMGPRELVRFGLGLAAEHRNFVCKPFRTRDIRRPPAP